jgi:multiple sugar transport system substrate-binding protein
MIKNRIFVVIAVVLVASMLLPACGAPAAEAPTAEAPAAASSGSGSEEVTLNVWNGFNAHEVESLNQMIEKYWTPTHPNIKINMSGEKYSDAVMTAISGGEPLDVVILGDPLSLKVWGLQGALLDLTPYIQEQGVSMDEVFVPAGLQWVRDQNGQYYGLPFVNFNYGFYWNKDLFRKAGLDPEKPPKTIDELEEYAKKLTIVNNGEIEQLGWQANVDMIDLGLAFGAKYYAPETGAIQANNQGLIDAINWDLALAKQYDITKVTSFAAGFIGEGNDPFLMGKIAMTINGCWNVTGIKMSGAQLDYGVGPIPYADPAYAEAINVYTNPIIIPKATTHSQEAWEFAWFLASNPDVSREFASLVSNLPQVQEAMTDFSSDPKTMVFVNLANSKNATAWAPIPAVATYSTELTTALDKIYLGELSVDEALAIAQQNTQAEVDALK